ncbi:MAG: tetraacyldisaccharide 4'-kinase [Gammaproteobacteria bacterium]
MPKRFEEIWYSNHPLSLALLPLAALFSTVVWLRRKAFALGVLPSRRLPVPVIVVGNICVGGSGKTPLVIWIAKFLHEQGFNPGVVSRGYGGNARSWPQQVRADSDAFMVGDEPVVIARHSGAPVAVGPNRFAAAIALLQYQHCDVIISDDGLQHYGLKRDVEIAVIDGLRRHGNGRCMPAGPLREPVSRLRQVDMIVTNGIAARGEFAMKYISQPLLPLDSAQSPQYAPVGAQGNAVHAVAGTGNPEGFFNSLRSQGFRVLRHPFPDHHAFRREDVEFGDNLPVVMTEKDAVKCLRFAGPQHWYQPIEAEMQPAFGHRLVELLKRSGHGQAPA